MKKLVKPGQPTNSSRFHIHVTDKHDGSKRYVVSDHMFDDQYMVFYHKERGWYGFYQADVDTVFDKLDKFIEEMEGLAAGHYDIHQDNSTPRNLMSIEKSNFKY